MSWVRFSAESDVYVYNSEEGVVCWFARTALDRFPDLTDPLVTETDEEMEAQLKALRGRGVKIPGWVVGIEDGAA